MSSLGGSSSNFTAQLLASSSATSISAMNNTKDTPKKIIRATSDHTAAHQGELSFQTGDFFWVMARENDSEYYEVTNPLTNTKGLVPVGLFEVLNQRKRPDSFSQSSNSYIISNLHLSPNAGSPDRFSSGGTSSSSRRPSMTASPGGAAGNGGVLYGLVMYDFEARPESDELDVRKGEYLILCAHHEFEWFIAKPINRLGGPGLVPVAYIKTLNWATKKLNGGDVVAEIKESGLPTVAEWKSKAAKYKAASISLNEEQQPGSGPQVSQQQRTLYEYDDNSIPSERSSTQNSHFSSATPLSTTVVQPPPQVTQLPETYQVYTGTVFDTDHNSLYDNEVYVTEISLENFYYNLASQKDENDGRYWYHVVAKLSNNKTRSLCRYYDDFYEFQVRLLKAFPDEAGNGDDNDTERTLPFIPGPVTLANDSISYLRFTELEKYLKTLIGLPANISRSASVLVLFNLRKDVDKEFETGEPLEIPDVTGFNSNGLDRIKTEPKEPSSKTTSTSSLLPVTTQPPPSLHSNSARSSADTKESQLSYQIGQLNVKTDLITTNATSTGSESNTNSTLNEGEFKPALKVQTSTTSATTTTLAKNMKIKFYYEDDIFAISVPTNISLSNLKLKISHRISHKFEGIRLFVKSKHLGEFKEDNSSTEVESDDFLHQLMNKDPKLKLILIADEGGDGENPPQKI